MYVGDGSTLSALASNTGSFASLDPPSPGFNAGGAAAYLGVTNSPTSGVAGVYRGTGVGPPTTIANTTGGVYSGFTPPSVNANDRVAFTADYTGGRRVLAGNGGPLTITADTAGPYSGFGSTAINASGRVAFYASLDAGDSGIFTGQNPLTDLVIRTGDLLDSSTVAALAFGNYGLNDLGEVAFTATLANGQTNVYRLSPVPEPAAILALTAGCLANFAAVWREVRHRSRKPG